MDLVIKSFRWLLLVLNVEANTIKVTGFSDRQKASKAVADIEQEKREELDAVLVWVRSARASERHIRPTTQTHVSFSVRSTQRYALESAPTLR